MAPQPENETDRNSREPVATLFESTGRVAGHKRKSDRGFTHTAEDRIGARHRFIPPEKKNLQADVETMHNIIEEEFFNLETFKGDDAVATFFRKAGLWQLWANTTRKSGCKGRLTPDDILREADPDRDPGVWNLPPLDLDRLFEHHVAAHGKNNPRGAPCTP